MSVYWLINQYASTPKNGIGGRHYYLAKELAEQGHKVYLIAAGFTHLLRQQPKLESEFTVQKISDNFDFVWIKALQYSGAHDKKRILSCFLFSWKLNKLYNIIDNKPDFILCSSPSPISFLGSQRLSKKFKTKLAFEVRDIWPLTLVELGGYSTKHPFIRFLQWIEDKAYRDSDLVLSNLPNSIEHMVDRGMNREKFTWIPNGINISELENAHPLNSALKLSLPRDKFIVGYTGTLGVANALGTLISAAKMLQNEKDIVFVIVGSGKEKSSLMLQAAGLSNVVFIDAIPKQQVQSMLAEFDICYIGWKNEKIYRFGIAPNKLPEYMFSSKPIIHSYSGAKDFVSDAKAGVSVPAENPKAVSNAVISLKSISSEYRQKMGKNGRNYAIENYDYRKLSKKLADVLC